MIERGETLVEVVVALLLLTVGALALATGIGEAQRARYRAASSGLALASAEGWLEAWRTGPARGTATGTDSIAWGEWNGVLEWRTKSPSVCVESAEVSVTAADVAVELSSRRFLTAGAGCHP